MSLRRLRRRVAGVRWLGRAVLEGHDLRFHKVGRDGSGKCDAFFTGDPRDTILGVLFHLDPQTKPALDRIEGLGAGYNEKSVQLRLEHGETVQAVTYVATRLDARLLPFCWYKDHVLAGARDAALPDIYVDRIRAVPSLRDPDRRRRARERSVHRRPLR
jgi:hypothetical protein